MFEYNYYRVGPGVVRLSFLRGGRIISAGSGFIARGFLVTNYHVFDCDEADTVVISFRDGETIRHSNYDFRGFIRSGSPVDRSDYAIMEIPGLAEVPHHDFAFAPPDPIRIGRELAVLGYPLGREHLTIHRGIVSAKFTRNEVQVYQLDASVNNGNSGGPLVELTNGCVVGIVTRKNSGLSDTFQEFRDTIDKNIAAIEKLAGPMPEEISGIGMAQEAVRGQRQLKRLCSELERSANTGIGYAFSIEHVARDGLFAGR